MPTILVHQFKTPVGELLLGDFEGELCLADWRYRRMRTTIDRRIQKGLGANYEKGTTEVIEETIRQLDGYFAGERTAFDIRLRLTGTSFQQRVWQALMQVPYGTTATYAGLAEKAADTSAVRAVAAANGANAISIIVPCHRIIGSSGELVGYAGGLPAKKKLLQLEGVETGDQQLALFQSV